MGRRLSLNKLLAGHGRAAVASATAEIPPAALTGLVGSNGAGKTTLLHTIAGLLPPIEGTVMLDTTPVGSFKPEELARQVSIVLSSAPAVDFTVEELVAKGRAPYTGLFGNLTAADCAIIAEALEFVGIAHLAQRRLPTLSDGERQKAAIARAIAQQTPVVLLDEPTAHLDLDSSIDLVDLLRELAHEKGKTILLASHDLPILLRYADQILLLKKPDSESSVSELKTYSPPFTFDDIRSMAGSRAADFLEDLHSS